MQNDLDEPKKERSWLVPLIAFAAALAVIAIVLAAIAEATRERIAKNQESWITAALHSLVPPDRYDNDLLADSIAVTSTDLLGTPNPVTIYRARHEGRPVAAILRPIAPDGYRGAIELLVAVAYDGTLIGVQVLRHNETPGLGNAFETRDTDWLHRFEGLSLDNPPQNRWTVRSEGGDFDAFTGATITPRAIVKAVRRALEYYRANRERIFRS